ncbi:MAG: HAD family phosphatase [Clostridia bacterium]|nr:HAD family phosphatase [Clostridia bacterium]
MKKLIAFDLDGTLTQHRSYLEEENAELLRKLQKKYKIIMVGAGAAERIYRQMNRFPIDIIGNYGMEESAMVNGEFKLIRRDKTYPDKEYFLKQAEYLREKYGYTEYKGESVEFHESGMVTFPLLGTKADIADKIAFDPTRAKRKILYPEVLELFKDYNVYIGGSSSFDFSEKKYNKYYAIKSYCERNGYTLDEALFVGDDYGEGGGDSHIRIHGIDYIEITDYKKVGEALSFLL